MGGKGQLLITHNSDLDGRQWRRGLPEERLDGRARKANCSIRETESQDL
jgi:hypothetical protein